jgi:hypothetical protein
MPRQADTTLQDRISAIRADLVSLEFDLKAYGDREQAKAVKRASRELMHPSITGNEHTQGVAHGAVRA